MPSAAAVLNTRRPRKDGTYPIVIRLIDGRSQKEHPLKYYVDKKLWTGSEVSKKHPDATIINSVIAEQLLKAKRYFADCVIHNRRVDLSLVFSSHTSHSFTEYLAHRAKQHFQADELEMYYKANRYVFELTACFDGPVYFSDITQDFLRKYDTWLKAVPNSANTRNKKFEFLGKYYNNAVVEGKASLPNPFKQYKIPTREVKKDKLTQEEFEAIEKLPLKPGRLKFARDIFLFSYFTKGSRFETCLTMRKDSIVNGRLEFKTNKGQRFISVKLHTRLQAIIDTYINNPTETIFGKNKQPLETIRENASAYRGFIGSNNTMVNEDLKDIADMAGVNIPLSMHHARHSFAYHFKKASNNIHVIKDSLGHARTNTTERYLNSLDDEYIDPHIEKLYGS